jgi:hypothetical protein
LKLAHTNIEDNVGLTAVLHHDGETIVLLAAWLSHNPISHFLLEGQCHA